MRSVEFDDSSFTKTYLNRRDFLKLTRSAILPLLFYPLAACAESPSNPENSEIEYVLTQVLELEQDFDRNSLAEQSALKMSDMTWLTGRPVGRYNSRNGFAIPIELNEIGELAVIKIDPKNPQQLRALKDSQNIHYPNPNPLSIEEIKINTTMDSDKKIPSHVLIYGTNGTITRLKSQINDSINPFLSQMFGFANTDMIAVHLNFAPGNNLKYTDVANLGYTPPHSKFIAHTHITPYTKGDLDGPLHRVDLYINLYHLHQATVLLGLTNQENLAATFVDEIDGLLGLLHPNLQPNPSGHNEAHSTLMGWLAIVNPEIIPIVLGGKDSSTIFDQLSQEMDTLHEIG